MIEQDTIKLLRECDAGIKMGITAIDNVLDEVDSAVFKGYLIECKYDHEQLQQEIQGLLHKYKDEGKEPNPIAKGMSRMKMNMRLGLDDSDETIAGLVTDGCNLGVKSLHRYLNQYKAADEQSKDITKRLVTLEDRLVSDIRRFL